LFFVNLRVFSGSNSYIFFYLKSGPNISLNIYSKKQQWKLFLFIVAVFIGVASLWYTNKLVRDLSNEERKKVELWAEGQRIIASSQDSEQDLSFIFQVIINNETVPVIVVDSSDNVIFSRNLDSLKSQDESYLKSQLELMKREHDPIEIVISDDLKQYIYYRNSTLLTKLYYYPFIQLAVIFLFILVAYYAFSSSRKAEQNQVWVGMSKETAHQLGTPISSLMAWVELLKTKEIEEDLVTEVEKDVNRLETITERFSKIGSAPALSKINITEILETSVNYIKSRSSDKINFHLNLSGKDEVFVPVNASLFGWVIENLCKNAIDAMDGAGTIEIDLADHMQIVYIDIKDTGKGLSKSKYKTIFQPGYTTKQRGWGLGLSLAKRIIEFYHSGKIFVKSSEINTGTTIRIALKK